MTTGLHAEAVVNFQLLLLTRKQTKILENAKNELFAPENQTSVCHQGTTGSHYGPL